MRFAPIFIVVLVAGCLEPANEGAPGGGSPAPVATPSPSPSPRPSPSPSPTTAATPASPAGPSDVAFRVLAQGSQSGITKSERVVITDRPTYEAFWARVREDATQPAPPVDFTQETVVGATLGARSNTCWAVRVTNATEEAGRTSVEVTTFSPPPELMCAQAITYPWTLVALDGANRDVVFVERTRDGPPAS